MLLEFGTTVELRFSGPPIFGTSIICKIGVSLNAYAQLTAVTMDTGMFIVCMRRRSHVH